MNHSLKWLKLLGRLALRLCILFAFAAFLYALPDPDIEGVVRFKNALVSLFTVLGIGVLIYNTFFYERYRM